MTADERDAKCWRRMREAILEQVNDRWKRREVRSGGSSIPPWALCGSQIRRKPGKRRANATLASRRPLPARVRNKSNSKR